MLEINYLINIYKDGYTHVIYSEKEFTEYVIQRCSLLTGLRSNYIVISDGICTNSDHSNILSESIEDFVERCIQQNKEDSFMFNLNEEDIEFLVKYVRKEQQVTMFTED